MKFQDLPREIHEQIFWAIDCPMTAHSYFEVVLVQGCTLGTQTEFFRFVVGGNFYSSRKKLEYLRQDFPDEMFLCQYASRSLFSTKPSSSLLLIGRFGKLRLA
jgi:hypothetical protein